MAISRFLLLIVCSLLFSSCSSYRAATLSGTDFLKNKKVFQHTGHYDIYVHQQNRLWKVRDAKVDLDGKLTGRLQEIQDPLPHEIALPADLKLNKEANNDVHLRLREEKLVPEPTEADSIVITEEDIRYVEMSQRAGAGKSSVNIFLLIIGILAAIAVAVVIALAVAINQAAESTTGCCATVAAYEDPEAVELDEFRAFRDKYLMKNRTGRFLISLYYKFSPAYVEHLSEIPWIRKPTRFLLDQLLTVIRPFI